MYYSKYIYDLYMKDVNKYSLLTEEEEKELLTRKTRGDEKARELLINSNLKLVVKVAFEYGRNYDDILSYIQAGSIGLIKAVDEYSIDYNTRLSTFAIPKIKKWIKIYIYKNTRIKIPSNIYAIYKAVKLLIEEYDSMNKPWDISLIAKELEINEEKVAFVLTNPTFDAKFITGDDENNIFDTIYDENEIVNESFEYNDGIKALKEYISCNLNEEEIKFIYYRYSKKYSIEKIADLMNSNYGKMYYKETLILKKLRNSKSKDYHKLIKAKEYLLK